MKTSIRTRVTFLLLVAALGGCSSVQPDASTPKSFVTPIVSAGRTLAPVAPPSQTLDAYKATVAQHIMLHNSEQAFSGRLPPMLPAVVVLNITVDENGELQDVAVQRSRDPGASKIAVDSMRRSGPLPKPASLLAANMRALTFSETFLFGDRYRFQLRTLAGPQ